MKWNFKIRMVKLGNEMHLDNSCKRYFQEYVLKHIDSFDIQAWDMFCNLTLINPNDMKKDARYWKIVYERLQSVNCQHKELSHRASFRMELIKKVYEELVA